MKLPPLTVTQPDQFCSHLNYSHEFVLAYGRQCAEAMREECAAVCEKYAEDATNAEASVAWACGDLIRNRGVV